jgi:N-acetyl-gamma-glutamyl-phosphate reductase
MKVSVIGATGYTGAELVKILLKHPQVEIETITSQSFANRKISEIYPSLITDLVCQELNINKIALSSSFIFTALPHRISMEIVGKLHSRGKKIIDLSADFRFIDPLIYEEWYGTPHQKKELLKKAIYGLPELYREKISRARLVANPGCYPTSSILALAPLVSNDLIKGNSIIIDAKSGVTGAGRALSLATHFPEVNENVRAYQVKGHRHTPEIEEQLSKLTTREIIITFVPHLVPINRGILCTCYAALKQKTDTKDLLKLYQDFYKEEPFVEILPQGRFPQTKEVLDSNRCRIGITVNERSGRAIIISAIDNLAKGAATQAAQNMNIMCGFEETMGLI